MPMPLRLGRSVIQLGEVLSSAASGASSSLDDISWPKPGAKAVVNEDKFIKL